MADLHSTEGPWLRHRTANAIALHLQAANAHLKMLRRELDPASDLPVIPLPCITLTRTVFEAALHVCWLLDTRATTDKRITRWAARQTGTTQDQLRVLRSFGLPPDEFDTQVEELREDTKRRLVRAGFTLLPKKGNRADETSNVSFGGVTSSLEPNIHQVAERFVPHRASMWTLASGTAHTQEWAVRARWGSMGEIVHDLLGPLLEISDALVFEIGAYLGLPVRPTLLKTHQHRHILLTLVGPPPAGLDEWRADAGLPPAPI